MAHSQPDSTITSSSRSPSSAGSSFCGEALITRRLPGFLVTVLGHRTASRTNRHTNARAYFSLLAAGSYREHDTSGRFEYAPGYIRFHPPGAEHDDEVGASGARFLCVEVTETVLAALPPRFRTSRAFPGRPTSWPGISG